MILSNLFLHLTIRERDSFMLAQMFKPGFHDKGFDIASRVRQIVQQLPMNRAIPAADIFNLPHHLDKLHPPCRINQIIDRHKHWPLFRLFLISQGWHRPVHRRRKIQCLAACQAILDGGEQTQS